MAVTINGTTGITNDGGYTGDGVVFADTTPANTLVTTTGGNVGVGTASPSAKLTVSTGVAGNLAYFTDAINTDFYIKTASSIATIGPNAGSTNLAFQTSGTERARINSSGDFLLNATSFDAAANNLRWSTTGLQLGRSANGDQIAFFTAGSFSGKISTSGTTTTYGTSSDYRLKNTVAPMTGALAKVALLKPVTYKWNFDNSDGQGFIAHELAEVCPDAVQGAKDAVDAEGNPQYQGIDVSFLVATLTAAIQELKAIVDAQSARITALETA